MSEHIENAEVIKLPIFSNYNEVIKEFSRNKKLLYKIPLIFSVILAFVNLISNIFVMNIVNIFFSISFAVLVQRTLISGNDQGYIFRFRGRELMFWLKGILIGIIAALPFLSMLIMMVVPNPIFIVILMTASVIMSIIFAARLVLILPATTYDDKLSLKDSWNLTEGSVIRIVLNHLLMMFYGILLSLIAAVLIAILSFITGVDFSYDKVSDSFKFNNVTLTFIGTFIICYVQYIGTGFFGCLYVSFYRFFRK